MKNFVFILIMVLLVGCRFNESYYPYEDTVEVIPVSPGYQYVWMQGYWSWDGHARRHWVYGKYYNPSRRYSIPRRYR